MRISWTEKVRNTDVLKKIEAERLVLLEIIKNAKNRFIQEIEDDDLFRTMMRGKIAEKPARGRRRLLNYAIIYMYCVSIFKFVICRGANPHQEMPTAK